MHWSGSRKRKQTNAPYPWYRHADPHDIEMTSYALMTLTRKRSVTTEVTSQILTILTRKRARPDAGSVARWLNMQRGPFGGFVSTRVIITNKSFFAFLQCITPSQHRTFDLLLRPHTNNLFSSDFTPLGNNVLLCDCADKYLRQIFGCVCVCVCVCE